MVSHRSIARLLRHEVETPANRMFLGTIQCIASHSVVSFDLLFTYLRMVLQQTPSKSLIQTPRRLLHHRRLPVHLGALCLDLMLRGPSDKLLGLVKRSRRLLEQSINTLLGVMRYTSTPVFLDPEVFAYLSSARRFSEPVLPVSWKMPRSG